MALSPAQWLATGLLPTTGLQAWHKYKSGDSANGAVLDYSGNARHLAQASVPPVIQSNLVNGHPGWYFDGSATNPLTFSGSLTVKHVFSLMAFEEAATFANYRGVFSGISSGGDTGLLTGQIGSNQFFLFGGNTPSKFAKNGVSYPSLGTYPAPMGGTFALIEAVVDPIQTSFDGIQVGKNRGFAGHIHKGWWLEHLVYSTERTQSEIERIRLYFNLEYAFWKQGLPLYFPSDDILGFPRSRFYAEPPKYSLITDSYEFEDGGRDFNEVADTAPRRWEYEYTHRTAEQRTIFDEFYGQARHANPFIFRDKYGVEWPNVRIEKYEPQHSAHKSWINEIKFDLIQYPV